MFIGELRKELPEQGLQDWCGALMALLSPVVRRDLYKVGGALGDLND